MTPSISAVQTASPPLHGWITNQSPERNAAIAVAAAKKATAEEIRGDFGKLDVLVNSADISYFDEITPNKGVIVAFHHLIATNFINTLAKTSAVLPLLTESKERLLPCLLRSPIDGAGGEPELPGGRANAAHEDVIETRIRAKAAAVSDLHNRLVGFR